MNTLWPIIVCNPNTNLNHSICPYCILSNDLVVSTVKMDCVTKVRILNQQKTFIKHVNIGGGIIRHSSPTPQKLKETSLPHSPQDWRPWMSHQWSLPCNHKLNIWIEISRHKYCTGITRSSFANYLKPDVALSQFWLRTW